MPDHEDQSNNTIAHYLKGIDVADDELASLRGSYMASCKGPRATIREIKREARDAGVNMKAFNAVLKDHRAERARLKRIAELENDDAFSYEQMREALGELGDTPLGSAALGRTKGRGGKSGDEALDSLRT
jgi:hypothetical protein